MSDKHSLRRALRLRRDAFVAEGQPAIAPPAAFRDRLAPSLIVASYMRVGSEADPQLLVDAAVAAGCRLALPHVTTRTAELRFLAWDADIPLTTGPFGLRQPDPAATELHPDIVLTPLLGFDAARHRLGQGAGHYDRAFARFPAAWRVGVAWSVQRVDTLPADPWDMPLHLIVTEDGIV